MNSEFELVASAFFLDDEDDEEQVNSKPIESEFRKYGERHGKYNELYVKTNLTPEEEEFIKDFEIEAIVNLQKNHDLTEEQARSRLKEVQETILWLHKNKTA